MQSVCEEDWAEAWHYSGTYSARWKLPKLPTFLVEISRLQTASIWEWQDSYRKCTDYKCNRNCTRNCLKVAYDEKRKMVKLSDGERWKALSQQQINVERCWVSHQDMQKFGFSNSAGSLIGWQSIYNFYEDDSNETEVQDPYQVAQHTWYKLLCVSSRCGVTMSDALSVVFFCSSGLQRKSASGENILLLFCSAALS